MQLCNACSDLRARGKISTELTVCNDLVDPSLVYCRPASIDARSNEEATEGRTLGRPALLGLSQSTRPVRHARERIKLAPGVEDHKRYGRLSEIELMNQSITRLTCQIPEEDLPRLPVAVQLDFLGAERPNMPGMRGLRGLKRLI